MKEGLKTFLGQYNCVITGLKHYQKAFKDKLMDPELNELDMTYLNNFRVFLKFEEEYFQKIDIFIRNPVISFALQPIDTSPKLVSTGLANMLNNKISEEDIRSKNLHNVIKYGYLTMDRKNRFIFFDSQDHDKFQHPILGIWFWGLTKGDEDLNIDWKKRYIWGIIADFYINDKNSLLKKIFLRFHKFNFLKSLIFLRF